MLPKDIYRRSSHVTAQSLVVFGKEYPQGTAVKFRPLLVMRRQGEIVIGDQIINFTRSECRINGKIAYGKIREEISLVAKSLNPPASEWNL